MAEQGSLLSEFSRKLIELEKKVKKKESASSHEESAVTPHPSDRKRPAEGKHNSFNTNL